MFPAIFNTKKSVPKQNNLIYLIIILSHYMQ